LKGKKGKKKKKRPRTFSFVLAAGRRKREGGGNDYSDTTISGKAVIPLSILMKKKGRKGKGKLKYRIGWPGA